jgi:hypothetical protein
MIRAPGMLAQQRRRQQPDDVVALDEAAGLVEEEAAVEVAVPGEAEVGAVPAHRLGGGGAVLRQQRIGDAVGKAAVGLMVDLDELAGEMRLQGVDDRAGAAVAGIDHHLQGFQGGAVDVAEQVRDVVAAGVEGGDNAGAGRSREHAAGRQIPDGLQTAVAADRLRSLPHQLHAVVIHGIMAGRHHDAAVHPLGKGGEIDLLRPAQADIEHVGAALGQPSRQRPAESFARQPHVTADDHPLRLQEFGVGPADAVGDVFVQFVGESTP